MAADSITTTSARLRGKVRSNSQATEYSFEYGATTSYGDWTPDAYAGSGYDLNQVASEVEGLAPGTTYHYRLVAENNAGETKGADRTVHDRVAPRGAVDRADRRPGGSATGLRQDGGRRARGHRAREGAGRRLGDAGAGRRDAARGDVRHSPGRRLRCTSAGCRGNTQTGRFGGGMFTLRQPAKRLRARGRVPARRALRVLARAGTRRARGGSVASASRVRRVRKLWGRDSGGRFPDARPSQPGHRARHPLADRRPLRRHAHSRHAGRRRRARLPPPPHGGGARRARVPRTGAPTVAPWSVGTLAHRGPLRPQDDRAQVAEGVGGRAHLGGLERARTSRPKSYVLEMLPYPSGEPHIGHLKNYSVGDAIAHFRRRTRRQRAAPDGLRRLRPAGREPRDQDRPASARVDRGVDRGSSGSQFRALGHLDRLDARVRHPRARVLPLDPVDLPAPVRARPRLPQGGRGQVVPQRPDRAGERAGDRRPLRALRHAGRGPPARAVVLQDHRLRRPPARRPRDGRVAAARRDDAAELDRPLGGRRGGLPLRGARDRLPRLHDAAGHAVRRDLLRHGARAPGRAAAERLAGGARVREPRAHRVGRGARRRGPREDRRAARPHRHQPGQRRGDPDVRRRLRADGVRHRRDHGGARARRARLRVRRRSSASRSGA